MDDIVYVVGAAGSTTESSGGSSVSVNADYKTGGTFTATYADANTIRLEGIPTAIQGMRSLDFVYLKILRNTGVIELIVNGVDDTFTYTANNPTTTGSVDFTSTALLSNDIYEIGINGSVSTVQELLAIEADIETLQTKTSLAGISMPANFFSPADFAVTYSNATQLTVLGAPFTVNDSNCFVLSVMVKDSTGAWTKYVNGANGVSIKADSDNTITIAGHTGTAFAATDLAYRVAINYQQKAFDPSTNSQLVSVLNPTNSNYVLDSFYDAALASASEQLLPSSEGFTMDGFKSLSLTGKIINTVNPASTDTLKVQVSNDEDSATADWTTIYGFNAEANAMVNQLTFESTGANGDVFAFDFQDLNYNRVRISFTAGSADSRTVIIKGRRTY